MKISRAKSNWIKIFGGLAVFGILVIICAESLLGGKGATNFLLFAICIIILGVPLIAVVIWGMQEINDWRQEKRIERENRHLDKEERSSKKE